MRLIDADAVMEMLSNIELSCTAIPMIEAKTRLRDIPTAYDVDKVMELEKENAEMKEVIRKLLCSEYGSSCQFCVQDNNDNAMCRKMGGSGSWCCENAAYDKNWNKRQVV